MEWTSDEQQSAAALPPARGGTKGGTSMYGKRRAVVLAAVAAVLAFAAPVRAVAGGSWIRPVPGATALAYGATWVDAAGRTCTHGGLDLVSPAGSSVRACAAGEIVFAGLVPAGEGASAYAVTVLTADGLRVTYLPLETLAVRKGQPVQSGGTIGSLAGSGDGSSPGPHLHLGVKRGSAALDPASFLAPVEPVVPTTPVPGSGAAGSRVTPPHPAPHAAPSPVPDTAPAPSGVHASAPAVSPVPAAGETLRGAVGAATGALLRVDPIARVEPVAAPAVLDLDRAGADLAASRASLIAWAVRVGLVLLAGACVIPVLRAARRAAAQPAAASVRRDHS